MSIPLGEISFSSISYKSEDLAKALSEFVIEGSKKGIILVSDITIITSDPDRVQAYTSVKEGLNQGNKLFDMLMYFALPADTRPVPRALNGGEIWPVIDDGQIARAVFYLAFYLLTRANVPRGNDQTTGSIVPAFLKNVLSFNESPDVIMGKIATFDLGKMDHKWIKYIEWGAIGSEALNRIGLGPAGYRMLSPFQLLVEKPDLPENIQQALAVARSMARQPADWEIHPITRSPAFTQKYGPLNANLGNLMRIAFNMDDLERLKNNKVLYNIPEEDVRNTAYLNWKSDMAFVSKDPIFKVSV